MIIIKCARYIVTYNNHKNDNILRNTYKINNQSIYFINIYSDF